MTELVVPKSIPIDFFIFSVLFPTVFYGQCKSTDFFNEIKKDCQKSFFDNLFLRYYNDEAPDPSPKEEGSGGVSLPLVGFSSRPKKSVLGRA
jgi:hypothetical protein